MNYDDFIPRWYFDVGCDGFICRCPVKNKNWCRVRSEDKIRKSNGKLNVQLV